MEQLRLELLESALFYASRGFDVMPLEPGGKKPTLKAFREKATHDPEKIKKMWSKKCFNVGVSTSTYNGSGRSLVGIDVDKKNGKNGYDTIKQLKAEGFKLTKTYTQKTPSGGMHLIYLADKAVKQGSNVLGPGLDIRSNGGYLVLSGSVINGIAYTTPDKNAPLAECPIWVIDRCGRAAPKLPKNTVNIDVDQETAVPRAIDYLLTSAPIAVEGESGDQTTFAVLAQLKDIGVLETTALELALEHWNDRCQPPWDASHLQTKTTNAYKYGSNDFGSISPEASFKPIDNPPPNVDKPVQNVEKSKKVLLNPIHFEDIEYNPSSDYLIDCWLEERALSVLYGAPNEGKTFFALDMALHVALGREWQGERIKQGFVVYLGCEGGEGLKKRVVAFKLKNDLMATPLDFDLITEPINLRTTEDYVDCLIELYKDKNPALMVVDTLAQAMVGGDENSPDAMGQVLAKANRLRKALKCHVMLVHHAGKDHKKGARGHSSLRGAIDTEIRIAENVAYTEKQRDMEKGKKLKFSLKQVVIKQDADGRDITSCVIEPRGPSEHFLPAPKLEPEIMGDSVIALEALKALSGLENVAVNIEVWRKLFKNHPSISSRKTPAQRQGFFRAKDILVEKGFVIVLDDAAIPTDKAIVSHQ